MLQTSVTARQSGPLITLSGETDLTSAAQLSALAAGQLSAGTLEMTIDLSGPRFADTTPIRALILTARTLTDRGGRLALRDAQPPMTKLQALLGADRMLTIRGEIQGGPDSEASTG